MEKRKLGNTGIEVSVMAFGTVELGIPYGIGVQEESQMLTEEVAIQLLSKALDNGINFFDTARQYGKSERLLGTAFGSRREEVVIATKCKHLRDKDHKVPTGTELEGAIFSSVEKSLEELRTNYIDVFMLHDSDEEIMQHPRVISAFENLKKQGVIKASGISTYTPAETKSVIDSHNWDVVQVPFNLLDQRQNALFNQLEQAQIGVVVRSVLMKGLLSSRGENLHPALKEVEMHIKKYKPLQKATAMDLPSLATRFVLSFPEVAAVLIGIDKIEFLQAAIDSVAGSKLEPDLLIKAKEMEFKNPDFLNLHQWSVNGWLK